MAYCFSTDMQEPDIVFGGEKKLEKAIDEAIEIFHPKAIMICSTCPIGLIGDDVEAVARRTEEKYGIKCVGFSCEGYKGVSQSGGHHIANNGLMKHIIGTGDKKANRQIRHQHPRRVQHRRRRLGRNARTQTHRLRHHHRLHRRRLVRDHEKRPHGAA